MCTVKYRIPNYKDMCINKFRRLSPLQSGVHDTVVFITYIIILVYIAEFG